MIGGGDASDNSGTGTGATTIVEDGRSVADLTRSNLFSRMDTTGEIIGGVERVGGACGDPPARIVA